MSKKADPREVTLRECLKHEAQLALLVSELKDITREQRDALQAFEELALFVLGRYSHRLLEADLRKEVRRHQQEVLRRRDVNRDASVWNWRNER